MEDLLFLDITEPPVVLHCIVLKEDIVSINTECLQEILSQRKGNLLRQHASIIKHDIFNIVAITESTCWAISLTEHIRVIFYTFPPPALSGSILIELQILKIFIAFTEIVNLRCTQVCFTSVTHLHISTTIYSLISMLLRGLL